MPDVCRVVWIYPDRGTAAQRAQEEAAVWEPYRRVAAGLGLAMSLCPPEDIAVDATDARNPVIYLDGERVTPADTIFVTALYSLPHQSQDVANQLFLFTILQRLGFYLPVPPELSYIGEDKLATVLHLAQSPIPLLPTVRIGSGRGAMAGRYRPALDGLGYPMIVKPAHWGMGLGVSVVHNVFDLRGVIGLAGGSGTPVVVQPYLGAVHDRRVYVVDGKAHTVLQGIKDGYCLAVTMAERGRHEREYVKLPSILEETVAYAASRLPTPYFALDFLFDGDRYWLSEIEVDGAVGFNGIPEQDEVATSIVAARLRAYADGHAAWIAS